VPAETRHHVFLAIKEALNNIVKHSRATEVLVELKLQPREFVFIIKDNGAGFTLGTEAAPDPERLSSGQGLNNFENRMKKLGGSCRITSEPNKGTAIEFFVPINTHKALK
jgi:signal transduction histidine kinase